MQHALDLRKAVVAGQHLFAANDPLSHADKALAAMFDGPLEGDRDQRALELQVQANRRDPHCEGAY